MHDDLWLTMLRSCFRGRRYAKLVKRPTDRRVCVFIIALAASLSTVNGVRLDANVPFDDTRSFRWQNGEEKFISRTFSK